MDKHNKKYNNLIDSLHMLVSYGIVEPNKPLDEVIIRILEEMDNGNISIDSDWYLHGVYKDKV